MMTIESVNPDLCNGCRLCLDTCPMDVFRMDVVVTGKNEFPACRMACPANTDMRNYIYKLRNGMIEDAIEVLKENLPLAAITGRVCYHPCEANCARNDVDAPVNINALERYTADQWLKEKAEPIKKIYSSKVAIIGSGPAGLSASYFLARKGYPVTVFETNKNLGGMLRTGIPDFRLPKDVLDKQIEYFKDMGIEFKPGVTIGKDLSVEQLNKDFDALFFAIGNQLSKKLNIEGINLNGVISGVDFLRDVNSKKIKALNGKVVVVGGGNVAIDAALSASRLKADSVKMVCVESADKMPAYQDEVIQAEEAGIEILHAYGPQRLMGDGEKVTGLELFYCNNVCDIEGRFNPSYDETKRKQIDANYVIVSIGQNSDVSLLPKNLELTEQNSIWVHPITLQTNLPGIFAGGDIVTGPASVIEAVAAGKSAAISIDRYLKGEDLTAGRYSKVNRVSKPPQFGVARFERQQTDVIDKDKRVNNFNEVKTGFTLDKVLYESQRCMTCGAKAVIMYPGDCQMCNFCEMDCPQNAVYVSPEKKILPIMSFG